MFEKFTETAATVGKELSRAVNITGLKVKHYSPQILVGVALVAGAGAIYYACKATHNDLDDILDEAEDNLAHIEDMEEANQIAPSDAKKEKKEVKVTAAKKLVKAYSPAVVLALVSASSTLGATHILSKRHAAVMASYAALDAYTRDYQQRVIDQVGEELEHKIRYDIHDDVTTVEEVDPDTGEVKQVEKVVENVAHQLDRFDFIFDESSPRFQDNSDYDEMFALIAEEYANKVLESRRTNTKAGYYFFDELLDQFDIRPEDITKPDGTPMSFEEAHSNGWYLPPKNEFGVGPNDIHHISLGLGDQLDRAKRSMMRDEGIKGILIHPNIDGVIAHLI